MQARQHSLTSNPLLSEDQVHAVLARYWSIGGRLSDLGSLQDQNVRVRTPAESYVLKIVSDTVDRDEVAVQNAAMVHIAAGTPGFASPHPLPLTGADGGDIVAVDGVYCRLLTWVPGRPYADRPYLRTAGLRALGALGARVALALEEFTHPQLDRAYLWDARRSVDVVADLADQLPEVALRDQVLRAVEPLARLAPDLPLAAIHGDITPTNVVCADTEGIDGAPAEAALTGILDFGDVMHSWRLADVAAAVVGVVEHPGAGDPLEAALSLFAGYHGVVALNEDEAASFWALVLARAAVNVSVSRIQSANNPTNWYALEATESSLHALGVLSAVPNSLAAAGARAAMNAPQRAAPHQSVPVVELVTGLRAARMLDCSVDTDELVDADETADAAWPLRPALRTPDELRAGGVAVSRWGEHRIDRAGELASAAPANLALGVSVHVDAGTTVRLPVTGTVTAVEHATNGHALLVTMPDSADLVLRVRGLAASCEPGPAAAGTVLGTATADLHVQLLADPALPAFGDARNRAAWLGACPDPSGLLGIDVGAAAPADPRDLRRRRGDVVAAPQHLYYEQPVEIVRGWRHFLYSADGRGYLDMINNIAAVGHSHPAVTRAAVRQLRRLNTNSRFLYDSMTRYSERMSALLPAELNCVFLVNSGSEAADLALQLARHYTGRTDVAAIAGAYHGWTGAVLALSTSPQDRPNWRAELQPGNHIVAAPNPYRATLGPACEPYVDSVRDACTDAARNGGLAAFVIEPLLGNQGAVEPFPGYLGRAFGAVRDAGGLCIADEVQVGMARTGDFWAFEHEGVVPDIVYTAKAAGNGHPLGVVACRREIADAFDRQAVFFASTGGGPVSCEIGLAVLDAVRDDGLQDNARTIGAYLRDRLADLATRHDVIGAVHGRALYLGVELVLDPATRQPATHLATVIGERMLDRGVIIQATGDAGNVLKVKPPLCLDRAAADFFVDELANVLADLVRSAR